MDDDVEALGPVGVVVDGVLVPVARVRVVGDGPLDAGALGDAAGEQVLLPRVVVAAPAEHQQRPDRPGRLIGVRPNPDALQGPREDQQQSGPCLHVGSSLSLGGSAARRAGPLGLLWVGCTGQGNPSRNSSIRPSPVRRSCSSSGRIARLSTSCRFR